MFRIHLRLGCPKENPQPTHVGRDISMSKKQKRGVFTLGSFFLGVGTDGIEMCQKNRFTLMVIIIINSIYKLRNEGNVQVGAGE